jgi:hypothetical protein
MHRYHDSLNKIKIPNIIPADEAQLLSRSYNNETLCNKINHIGFMPVYFCAVYAFDPDGNMCSYYDPKYANEN